MMLPPQVFETCASTNSATAPNQLHSTTFWSCNEGRERVKLIVTMLLKAKPTNWQKVDSDTVVFFVSEGNWKKELGELDRAFFAPVVAHAEAQGFSGGVGKFFVFPLAD